MSRFYRQLKQVAFSGTYAFGDSLQCLVHLFLITSFFQATQILNLFLTNGCIINFEDVDRFFFLQSILVNTNDSLLTRVNASLSTRCSFFDTHLRNTCFDSLSHTTKFLYFLNVFPCAMNQFVCQCFYVIRTSPWVNVFTYLSFFLYINLSITCDTCREIGRQCDSLIESVGMKRLSMT